MITLNEYGVHKKGGIVRFILFGNRVKFFLNRTDDPKDDSLISQTEAKESPFTQATLKLRDVNGKWAVNHDLAYIGAALIEVSKLYPKKSREIKDRKLIIQWAARDYYQQIPLTYHYVDTSEVAKITDEGIAKSMPYEYEDYDIE